MPFAVEVVNLTKKFFVGSKSVIALEDISLNISSGEIFGIIGPSGAGKSTLLRCMSTLESEFSGTISFQGDAFDFKNKTQIKKARARLGMIFQHFLLLESRNVFENILLPLEFAKVPLKEMEKKAEELLSLVGLEKKRHCYPASLSGGEKQRVAIARALATSPQVLFCDEATSSLDPKTTLEILDLLKKLNKAKGITIILITHEMDVVRRICDRVAVIDEGKILEEGNVLDLFTTPKEALTKKLVQTSSHELDISSLTDLDSESIILRLHFKGASAQKPLLSQLISQLHLEVNILSGWIDNIQSTSIGCLTITLKGTDVQKKKAFDFLKENNVSYEVLS
jgi:D-methionine transport system ATP-binding protein